jgi:hypothetical protein
MAEKKQAAAGLGAVKAVPVGIKVIKKGEPIPEPSDAPVEGVEAYGWDVKPPEEHLTIADKLDFVCAQLGGARHYRERERLRDEDDNEQLGDVILKLKLTDGTVLGGKGPTTAEAFNALLTKVQHFAKAGLTVEAQ